MSKFTSKDLYDQLITDEEVSLWLCREMHLVYDEVSYAFWAGFHRMNYTPSNDMYDIAYKAGLDVTQLR